MVLQRYRPFVWTAVLLAAGLLCWVPAPSSSVVVPEEEQAEPDQPEESAGQGSGGHSLNLRESLSAVVTVHAFSGAPDPRWKLSANQIATLAALIDELNPITLDKPWRPPSRLGYKGFSLEVQSKEGSAGSLFVYDNIVQGGEGFGSRKGSGHRLEKWLVGSGGSALKRNVRRVVLRDIRALDKGSGRNVNRNRRGNSHGTGSSETEAAE
ncbi:MAG: hypothetical protein AB1646_01700 [Thermodesulfobacteriota bacterium]